MVVRITLPMLRRLCGKYVGTLVRRSTDRRSVLLGLMPIGPSFYRLAFSWTYRDAFYDFLVEYIIDSGERYG